MNIVELLVKRELLAFYVFEVANGLVYTGYEREGIGVLCKYAFQISKLVFVDYAHQHLQIGMRVHSTRVNFRNGVVKVVNDILRNFISVFCDDFHLDSAFVGFEHIVADHYRYKTVQNTQDNWVHCKVVHKVTGNCHSNVQNEYDMYNARIGFEPVIKPCNYVSATR